MSGAGRVGAAGAPILTFEDVVKRYGQLEALRGVSCQVNRGEVVCLIGPSGSGKSTLLRCANALETLEGGRITFDGADVHAIVVSDSIPPLALAAIIVKPPRWVRVDDAVLPATVPTTHKAAP